MTHRFVRQDVLTLRMYGGFTRTERKKARASYFNHLFDYYVESKGLFDKMACSGYDLGN